jgi:hypothetical protein
MCLNETGHQPFIDYKIELYSALIKSGVTMKPLGLIKICYSKFARVNICDNFHIKNDLKQGDVLWPLLSNFALVCDIRKFQKNQVGI